ncbi:ABC transporter ATP-binding protein [Nocardia sp. NPDC057353]|uniref:ABC transporter ATP-binding protein n=1 Tax=Nocardia sp. NPDC057353 TaxID=3346104 RepID=UPI00362BF350
MIRTLLRVLGPGYAGPLRRTLALVLLAAVAEGAVCALLVPLLRALFGDRPGDAGPWVLALAAAVAGYAVLRYAADLSGFKVGATMLRGLYHRFGDHLARLPLGWYGRGRVGEVSVLAGPGVLQAMSVVAHLLGPLVFAIVTPLTVLVTLAVVDWRLGLAAAAAAPLLAAVRIGTDRAETAADAERLARDQAAADRIAEYLHAQPILRTAGRTGAGFDLLDAALREIAAGGRRAAGAALPAVAGTALAVQAVFTALLALGVHLALDGTLGAADLLVALVLAARCAEPLLSLAELGSKLRGARTVLNALDAVLRTPPLPEPARPRTPAGHALAVEHVTFRYDGHTVLDDVSLTVPQGGRLAIVGPSGAGKSTLLHLLARFHDVDAGAIRIGGADLRDVAAETLAAQFAVVFQDVYLFDGTLEQNVRVGRPGATDAEVRAAARAARVDAVVARLPGGWSTRVGPGGARLSGGERQRVSIARALLKDAPVVLLDEVSAALDAENESAVHAGIERLAAGRTVVTVAHRLDTVRTADHIVFLDGGRIAEQGSHDELLRLGGRYADFWAVAGT